MTDSTKVFIGVFVGIGLAAIAGLIFILLNSSGQHSQDENGLMQVCWQENGLANFDPETCPGPVSISWPSDLGVRIQENESPAETEMLQQISAQLNDEIGCQVFVVVPRTWNQPYDVVVQFNVPVSSYERDLGGSTYFSRFSSGIGDHETSLTQRAYVDIYAMGFSESLIRIILKHELGHVLGLDHDTLSSSIMRPAQSRNDLRPATLSEHDRALLHSSFCER